MYTLCATNNSRFVPKNKNLFFRQITYDIGK